MSKRIDLTNKTFGEWLVLGPAAKKQYWTCECSCKKVIRDVFQGSLTSGRSTNCGHVLSSKKIIDLKGQIFGPFIAVEYIGGKNGEWLCRCTNCNDTRLIRSAKLRSGDNLICTKCSITANFIDLKDKVFGRWAVIDYAGNGAWLCRCSCEEHTERIVLGQTLRNGESKSCGCMQKEQQRFISDLTDKQFGEWTVKKYCGNSKWLCECSCGTLREIATETLNNGTSRSCGSYKHNPNFKDLSNTNVGNWHIIDYAGNGLWNCECKCGRRQTVLGDSLKRGQSLSCGHCIRKDWQIEALQNKEKFNSILANACISLNTKLTILEITEIFNINYSHACQLVHKYESEQYVQYLEKDSTLEQEILDYVQRFVDVERHNTTILNGYELDIYNKEHNFAIEVNGSYWHSTQFKTSNYHQKKTLACMGSNIHMLHIFEHEWRDSRKQNIIKSLIKKMLNIDTKIIYARDTELRYVNIDEARQFEQKHHLKGFIPHTTALGLYYDNKLIELMTFGTPRFTSDYDTELLRLCSVDNIVIVGGASKLFTYYTKRHNAESIISYCDLSKFNGRVYTEIGMQFDTITSPGYVYVNMHTLNVLSRLNCTKSKLVQQGWGEESQTEEEIMHAHNYKKIYDCGNARYIYRPSKQ